MPINERALLVKLSVSQWYNRVIDRKVTDEVAQRYEVTEQEDRYVKTLLPRVAVRNIQRAINDLRTFHYANTLPWQDDSVRILSSSNFFQYQQGIAARRAKLEEAVDEFVKNYPKWLDYARKTKKGLFDETQYPTASGIRDHYKVSITFLPFPNVADFRVDIDGNELERIKRQTEQALSDALASANQHLIDRLYERVYLLYSALNDPEKIFRDNTVNSIVETADLVERLNVTNDTRVASAVAAARAALQDVHPDMLRSNPDFRNKVALRCAELLTAFKKEP
ncbi:MAG: hypothetical protein KatS3mg015_2651 [Fimbriimonadales bacterium]|nr:MAG: hypothetical protein KatS3mg015_2651 [Fimbriimonadales bacterium]